MLTEKGGALFGYTDLYGGYDGGQAEYVRVPYAAVGPRKVPDNLTDEQVLFLTDIFPTGYTGIDWARVKGGETVAIFGVIEQLRAATYDNFPLGQFFDKGITLKGGQAPAHKHIDTLLKFVQEGKVQLDDIITHRLPLSQIAEGYSKFKKKEDNCVKVVLNPW